MSSAFPGTRCPSILTESFCERCGTRYTFESAQPQTARLKGFKVVSRGPEELRHVGRHVARRGHGRGAERDRPRGHLPAARRVPQDVQLLHDVPAIHVQQLLERGRGPLPDLRPEPRPRDLPSPFPDLAADGGLAELHAERQRDRPRQRPRHEPQRSRQRRRNGARVAHVRPHARADLRRGGGAAAAAGRSTTGSGSSRSMPSPACRS